MDPCEENNGVCTLFIKFNYNLYLSYKARNYPLLKTTVFTLLLLRLDPHSYFRKPVLFFSCSSLLFFIRSSSHLHWLEVLHTLCFFKCPNIMAQQTDSKYINSLKSYILKMGILFLGHTVLIGTALMIYIHSINTFIVSLLT